MATYNQSRDLMERGAAVYLLGGPEVRRLLTRSVINPLVGDTGIEPVTSSV
jgi:hypothetical protein